MKEKKNIGTASIPVQVQKNPIFVSILAAPKWLQKKENVFCFQYPREGHFNINHLGPNSNQLWVPFLFPLAYGLPKWEKKTKKIWL